MSEENIDITSEYSDEQIQQILNKHINDKKYKAEYYRNKYHNDPEHRRKCLERSRKNYIRRKDILKERYKLQKELTLFKKNYKYHKDKGEDDNKFIEKYPELWEKYSHHVLCETSISE